MLIGKLKKEEKLSRKDVLNDIRQSERLECLRTFNKLFKDRTLSDLGILTVDIEDVVRGLESNEKSQTKKDYNMEGIMKVLTIGQEIQNTKNLIESGMTDAKFAELIPDCLIIDKESGVELSTGENDGLKYVWEELKNPGKNTIDFETLKQLYTEYGGKEVKYSDEELKLMLNITSTNGHAEITYDEFRKLFQCDIF